VRDSICYLTEACLAQTAQAAQRVGCSAPLCMPDQDVSVAAPTVRLVGLPLSLIALAISCCEFAPAAALIGLPVTLIHTAVRVAAATRPAQAHNSTSLTLALDTRGAAPHIVLCIWCCR